MEKRETLNENIVLEVAPECADTESARRLLERFGTGADSMGAELTLRLDGEGLSLISEGQILKGDFTRMLPRLKAGKLQGELLVRTAKIKGADGPLTAVDATAGLGEDSLLLAAAGFQVILYERNPVVYELLRDTLDRASAIPELAEITARMDVRNGDSIEAMARLEFTPDVILLDPMFPERQKSALVKKKLQLLQQLEKPCDDEAGLLRSAMEAKPQKILIKRPVKGPYLAGIRPSYSVAGSVIRYDCILLQDM